MNCNNLLRAAFIGDRIRLRERIVALPVHSKELMTTKPKNIEQANETIDNITFQRSWYMHIRREGQRERCCQNLYIKICFTRTSLGSATRGMPVTIVLPEFMMIRSYLILHILKALKLYIAGEQYRLPRRMFITGGK